MVCNRLSGIPPADGLRLGSSRHPVIGRTTPDASGASPVLARAPLIARTGGLDLPVVPGAHLPGRPCRSLIPLRLPCPDILVRTRLGDLTSPHGLPKSLSLTASPGRRHMVSILPPHEPLPSYRAAKALSPPLPEAPRQPRSSPVVLPVAPLPEVRAAPPHPLVPRLLADLETFGRFGESQSLEMGQRQHESAAWWQRSKEQRHFQSA
jgi:hypothetical protein